MSKSDLAPIDIAADDWRTVIGVLRARVPDRDVWAFGSRANWKAKEFSDLDLAVGGSEPLSLDTLANLTDDFEVLDLPFRVDVVDLASVSPEFKRRIETSRILVQTAAEVKFVRLGDACTKIGSGATPRGGKDVYIETGPVALIRSQNIYNDGFKDDGLAYINWEQAKKLANVEVRKNDVLLNITGDSVARCCMAPDQHLPARVNQHVAIIRPDPTKLNPVFLRFFLVSPSQQERMLGLASSGATRQALTKDMIESFTVPCPPIEQQDAIASVLQAIEERITLLSRSSAALEAMARAIFKSWFVDFDPVRAKAEGREPEGMDAATTALFPNEFVESELGLIPEGWQFRPVKDLLVNTIGGDWGKEEPDQKHTELVAIIRGTDMPKVRSGGISGIHKRYVTAKKLESRALVDGDIVIEVSGGSPTQPTGRSIFITDATLNQFTVPVVPASFCRLFRPSDKYTGLLLAQHLSHIYAEGKMWGYQNQSTGISNFQTKHFLDVEAVCIPSPALLSAFHEIVRPLVDRQQLKVTDTLAELRDTLLPRLISGKLRVPEAEKMVEAVL